MSPNLNWKLLLMPALNCILCGFISTQMCLLWKSSAFLLVKSSSVKSVELLKMDLHHIAEVTSGTILGLGEKKRICILYLLQMVRYNNCSGRTQHTSMYTKSLAACMDVHWYGDSLLSASVCAVYRRKTYNTGLPLATLNRVKRAFVQKPTLSCYHFAYNLTAAVLLPMNLQRFKRILP
jgi:hypothetical protein